MGPLTVKPKNGSATGALGTKPTVGRNATMLLKLAGLRNEPPKIAPAGKG